MSRRSRAARSTGALIAVLSSAILAGAVVSPAAGSPAHAAPARAVPAGEALSGISCDWAVLPDMLHLFGLDPDSGAGALTGSTPRVGHSYVCGRALVWDRVPGSCSAYTVAHNPDMLAALLRTDLMTGTSTLIVPLTLNGATTYAAGMVIDPTGVAWVLTENLLTTIDLATGVLTPVTPITGATLNSLAWDAVTGSLVGASDRSLHSIDSTTGATTVLVDLSAPTAGTFIEGMTVDGDGTFWLTVRDPSTVALDSGDWASVLWSVRGGVAQREGSILVAGAKLNTLALTSLPERACQLPTLALAPVGEKPQLAATGLEDATPILLPAAAVVLAIGALLVSFARRARQAGARHRGSRRAGR